MKNIIWGCLGFFLLGFLMNPVPASGAQQLTSPKKMLEDGDRLFKKGAWDAAQDAFMKAAKSPRVDERIQAYEGLVTLYRKLKMSKKEARALGELEKEKEFKRKLLPEDEAFYETYQVVKGDTYGKIAARRKISIEWLKRVNGNKMLVEGKTIKVPKEPYTLIIDKKEKKLFWKRKDEVLKVYPVSIGRKETETPEGQFRIEEKIENPVWYRMNQVFPPDSPKNLLGTRWMGLDLKGYGIHGTRNPNSIGSAASHGCIRMFNQHVEEIFSWVPIGTPVIIGTGENLSMRPRR